MLGPPGKQCRTTYVEDHSTHVQAGGSPLPPAAQSYTRITLAAASARAAVSVPDTLPVALLLPQLTALVGAEAGPRWALTHPVRGELDPAMTLGGAGILDGELLYLREAADGWRSPLVEDVAEEAADAVAERPGPTTRLVVPLAAGLWLGLTGPALLWVFGDRALAALVLVVAVVLAAAAAAALAGERRLTGVLGWAAVPALGSLAVAAAGRAGAGPGVTGLLLAVAVGVGAVGNGLLAAATGRPRGLAMLAAAVPAAAGLLLLGLLAVLLGGPEAAGVTGILGLAVQGALPGLATRLGGLGRLADAAVDGRGAARDDVRDAAARSNLVLTGLLAGTGLVVAVCAAVLAWRPDAAGTCLATLLGLALLLRARRSSRAVHRLPLNLAGLAALFAVGAGLLAGAAEADPALVAVGALAFGAVLIAVAVLSPADPGRARLRLALDRVELVVLVACGPALLWVFDAFRLAADAVR
jgi:type VII secretion integral membrane protein EccD